VTYRIVVIIRHQDGSRSVGDVLEFETKKQVARFIERSEYRNLDTIEVKELRDAS
jgi:hypothetical protein